MLLDILNDLGVRLADSLMIGDTTFDLEMARNAGTAGRSENLGPIAVVSSFPFRRT